jgi:hypothetical protein
LSRNYHILLTTLLPCTVFFVIYYSLLDAKADVHYFQIALSCAYITFIITLTRIDLEAITFSTHLKNYWTSQKQNKISLEVPEGQIVTTTFETTLAQVIKTKQFDNLMKVRAFSTDTETFITRLKDNSISIVLANIVLILFLSVLHNEDQPTAEERKSSSKAASNQQTILNSIDKVQLQTIHSDSIVVSAYPLNFASDTLNAKISDRSAKIEENSKLQDNHEMPDALKHISGFLALIVQVVFILAQILLHRTKNRVLMTEIQSNSAG